MSEEGTAIAHKQTEALIPSAISDQSSIAEEKCSQGLEIAL